MNLKILFIPVAITVTLIVVILYIKPDYSIMQAKKVELAVKNDQVAKMDSVIGNIHSLEEELKNKKDTEEFLYRYFPKEMDHSRIVDAFNFLAEQTGVVLASLTLEEAKKTAAEELLFPPNEGAFSGLNSTRAPNGESDIPRALPPAVVVLPPQPTKATLKVSAEGTYANMKEFMTRISHMDRFNEFTVIQLAEKTVQRDGQQVRDAVNPLLAATLEIRLDFLREKKIESALTVPFFQSTQFDLTRLDVIKRWITNPLPDLNETSAGKTNPFQR